MAETNSKIHQKHCRFDLGYVCSCTNTRVIETAMVDELDLTMLTEKERDADCACEVTGCGGCSDGVEALRAQLAHIRGVLREHEWDKHIDLYNCQACIVCGYLQENSRHADNCWLSELLQEEKP